jgi:hypothetical protein
MSWRMTRLRLAQIGPEQARYNGIVELTDRADRPADAVALRLVNGGGKGVLLQHVFNVLVPGEHGVIGDEQRNRGWQKLGAFVLGRDLAHLAIEWRRGDETLITGKTMQWRHGHASRDRRDLIIDYYLFSPGSLTLETLPFQADGRWLSREAFRKLLHDTLTVHGHDDPGLVATDVQREWIRALNARGIDSELFRWQARMNDGEGDADVLIKSLRTNEDFMRRCIEMLCDEEEIDALQGAVRAQRQALIQRDLILAEADLFALLGDGAEPLVGLAQEQLRADAEHRAARAEGEDLWLGLLRTEEAATARLPAIEAEQQDAARRAADARGRHGIAKLQALTAAQLACELDVNSKAAEFEQATARDAEARTEALAWQAAPHVAQEQRLQATRAGLERRMAEVDRAAEPYRQAAVAAADSLRRALRGALARQRERMKTVQREAGEAEDRRVTARYDALEHVKEASRLEERLRHAEAAQTRLQTRIQTLVRDGALPSGVTACAHRDELRARRLQLETTIADVEPQVTAATRARDTCAHQERARREQHDATATALRSARADAAAARAMVDVILQREALADVLDADPATLDLWADVPRVRARLNDHVAVSKAQEAELLAGEHARRVLLDRIGATGRLPADNDCERVLAALSERRIAAVSGWQQIHDGLAPEHWLAAVRRAGALAASVVLTGGGADPQGVVSSLDDDTLRLQRAVPIFTSAQFHELIDSPRVEHTNGAGPGTQSVRRPIVLVRSAAGLVDPTEAERAQAEIEAELAHAHERRSTLASAVEEAVALRSSVLGLLDVHPSDPRIAADTSVGSAERALATVEDQLRDDEVALHAAERRADELTRRLERHRSERDQALRDTERLSDVADEEERLSHPDHAPDAIAAQLRAARAAQEEAEETEAAAQLLLRTLEDEADSLRAATEALDRELASVELAEGEAITDGELALDQARAAYRAAHDVWRAEATDEALQRDHGQIVQRLEESAGALSRFEPPERERAADLLTRGVAGDDTFVAGQQRSDQARDSTARILGQVESQLRAARASVGNAKDALEAHIATLRERRQRFRLTEQEQPRPGSAAEARALEATFSQVASAAEVETSAANSDERRLRGAAEDLKQLTRTTARLRRALPEHPEPTLDAPPLDGDVEALDDRSTAVQERLDETRAAVERLRERRAELAGRVRALAVGDWPDQAGQQVRRQISAINDPVELADWCARHHRDLTTRLEASRQELTRLDERTGAAIDLFAKQIRHLLRLLRQLPRVSQMPDGLGQWSGRSFVQVALERLPDDGELRTRATDTLTAVLEDEHEVKGRDLLFRGALAACGGRAPRVRFLRPDIGLPYEPVDLGTGMSGGQGVTAGVALYCTLANLRRSERSAGSLAEDGGGALLLDNPFGKTTSSELLEVMFRVARRLGVQIIAFTPSTEDQVARQFPVLVQLRNSRGMRGGLRHVRVEEVRYRDDIEQGVTDETIAAARLLIERR